MNALSLLETYDSSDSDDSVGYSSDNKKMGVRLPVPDVIGKEPVSRSKTKEIDENGKIRNFPHEPGNWATYVHIPVTPFPELLDFIYDIKCAMEPVKLDSVNDFHISLTKTVVLRHHWIQDFTNIIRNALTDVNLFKVYCSGLKVFVNDQKTRTFVSLRVHDGFDFLSDIVEKLDVCLEQYNLEPFYKDPSFHMSLLWCPGDKFEQINSAIKNLPSKVQNFNFSVNVLHCICVSGNKTFRFDFQKRHAKKNQQERGQKKV